MYFAVSCQQYLEDSYKTSGVYRLFVDGPCKRPVNTICDQSKLYGGGWTLLVIKTFYSTLPMKIGIKLDGKRGSICGGILSLTRTALDRPM